MSAELAHFLEDAESAITSGSTQDGSLVLSIDPGLKTGIALVHRINDHATKVCSAELDWTEGAEAADRLIIDHPMAVTDIVAERFLITAQTAKNSQAPWSLYALGCLMLTCHRAEREVVLQKPAQAKAVVDNAKLQRLGLWHRGGAGHANDALRHAVVRLINVGWRDPRLLATD